MTLGEKQELFGRLYCVQLAFLTAMGYQYRLGDVFASTGHRAGSNHYLKLAGDINLFMDGFWLKETMQHQESGEHWESLHPLCRWGGNWDKDSHPGEAGENDGNHYSLIHNGSM